LGLIQRDAANFLDLGSGQRLVVGNDGQCLHGRARGFAHHRPLDLHEWRQVGRGSQCPAVADLDQIDAAIGVERGQLGEQFLGIGLIGQMAPNLIEAERFGGGEEKRLD
jgi:hypothetical protein